MPTNLAESTVLEIIHTGNDKYLFKIPGLSKNGTYQQIWNIDINEESLRCLCNLIYEEIQGINIKVNENENDLCFSTDTVLKKQGHEVIGVFMKFWSEENKKDENRCCSLESENRARLVARIIGIPFYVFNFKKEFKKRIVDSFLKEYRAGSTPNPCVICNKEIKFGLLLKKATLLNADFIATGHYVRTQKKENIIHLLKGRDKNKDQSYFLWQLNQGQLRRVLFPVGDLNKTEVRKLAKKFKLPFAKIPESQEICFVSGSVNDFLRKYLKQKKGNIVDVRGNLLGRHNGLIFYTIGQRKGIGLSGGPYYVLSKNLKKNLLIVTKNEKDLEKKKLIAKNINWLSGKEPKLPLKIKAKIRYRSELIPATIRKIEKTKYNIRFDSPQRAITSGQSVVFYKGEELLAGGIIS